MIITGIRYAINVEFLLGSNRLCFYVKKNKKISENDCFHIIKEHNKK